MTEKLPIRLTQEPLVDAVFEIRFASSTPASDVVPGFLYGKLGGMKKIERLPTSDLPRQIRDSDPNLQFAPLVRVLWGEFILLIGDRNLAVACKIPYPGWSRFRPAILEIIDLLKGLQIIKVVSRFSMKYVDLVPATSILEQVGALELRLALGGHELREESFQIRVDVPKDGFINVVQLVSGATANLPDGRVREGVIVDIDTIQNLPSGEPMDTFCVELPKRLERIHDANKRMFFDCLRKETIAALGAVYE